MESGLERTVVWSTVLTIEAAHALGIVSYEKRRRDFVACTNSLMRECL